MIKLSVSKAARIIGVSRLEMQKQINSGKLQTFEGYVTTDSLRLAYPNIGYDSEQDRHIQKMQQIKNDAIFKAGSADVANTKNEKILMDKIKQLNHKMSKEKLKNQHYEMVFAELAERIKALEKCCHAKDKASLHKLQNWVKQQTH